MRLNGTGSIDKFDMLLRSLGALRQLLRDCWEREASKRPSFEDIVTRLRQVQELPCMAPCDAQAWCVGATLLMQLQSVVVTS